MGFESQVVARTAATAFAASARAGLLTITGAALVRRDTEGGFHVDTYRELAPSLPAHAALVVDPMIEGSPQGSPCLEPGQAALIVSVADASEGALETVLQQVQAGRDRPLWTDSVSVPAG